MVDLLSDSGFDPDSVLKDRSTIACLADHEYHCERGGLRLSTQCLRLTACFLLPRYKKSLSASSLSVFYHEQSLQLFDHPSYETL